MVSNLFYYSVPIHCVGGGGGNGWATIAGQQTSGRRAGGRVRGSGWKEEERSGVFQVSMRKHHVLFTLQSSLNYQYLNFRM
jgi:hypothetical protein